MNRRPAGKGGQDFISIIWRFFMKPLRRLRKRAVLALLIPAAATGLHAQVTLRHAAGAGGVQAAGSGTAVVGTFGQAIIGPTATVDRRLEQGFWVPAFPSPLSAADPVAGRSTATPIALQCSPNPLAHSATIRAAFPGKETAALTLHDLLGREVLNLTNRSTGRQEESATFELTTESLENGWYTLLLVAGEERTTLPIHILR